MRLRLTLKHTASILLAILLFCGFSTAFAAETQFYRYTDEKGVLVMNSSIPPEYVKRGYEIVTLTGKVIEVVPPAMTEEQAELATANRMREAELAEWDKSLRLRYSSVAEVESAKNRKLESFDANILILQSNADTVRGKIVQSQGRAANVERSGRAVPQRMIDEIEALNGELKEIQQQIELRNEERNKIAMEYDEDIARFKIISGK
ncbi:hypothetical protein [Aurantivibrio infirmus]